MATSSTGEIRTNSGFEIVFAYGAERPEGTVEFIRNLDRALTRFFLAPRISGKESQIQLSPVQHIGQVRLAQIGQKRNIVLNDRFFVTEKDNPEVIQRLASAMLQIRFNTTSDRLLPYWIVAGLQDYLATQSSQKNSLMNLGSNYYPTLRAMIELENCPNFRNLMLVKIGTFDGIVLKSYQEFCRFLLVALSQNSTVTDNPLGDYAMSNMEQKLREDEVFENTLIKQYGLNFESSMQNSAIKIAFSSRMPYSAKYSLKKLPEIFQVEREKEKQIETIGLLALPKLLSAGKVEDLPLKYKLLEQITNFSQGLTPEVWNNVSAITKELELFDGKNVTKTIAELEKQYNDMVKKLHNLKAVESYLEQVEANHISPLLIFSNELSEVEKEEGFLFESGKEFFNNTEKKYLQN